MTPKDPQPDDVIVKKTEPEPAGEHKHSKRRKHGYRGYPNNPAVGGGVHTPTGFAGVGSTGGAGSSESGIISDKTREAIEELGEDED